MDTTTFVIWTLIGLAGLAGSALFSGLETGAYSLNRLRLHVLAHRGDARANRLRDLIGKPTALLGTLLIGNNIANYLGTAGVTVIIESFDLLEWQIVLINVAVVTPMLFVFGETLPKDLFGRYSDRLLYPFAGPLFWLSRFFTWIGALPLIAAFTRAVSFVLRVPEATPVTHPRRQVQMLVREGAGVGLISDEQSVIVEHILALSERSVADEMIRWSDVRTVSVDDGADALWALAESAANARFPVVDAQGMVVGVVHLYDALLHERATCPPMRELMHKPTMLDHATPLRDALAELQGHHVPLAIVTRDGRPTGIVTVKDLVEPITGELARW